MRLVRPLLLLSTLTLLPATAPAADLLQVYTLARRNDTVVHAAGFARDAALQSSPIARAALLPTLTAQAATSRQEDEITQTITEDANGNPIPPTEVTFSSSSEPYNASVTLLLPLFDRESWIRLRQAGDQVALAHATYRSAEQDLTLRVTDAYFNVLAADDNLRFAKAENEAVGRQLEQAKKRFDVGLSAITDVQEAQARYDLTVAQLIDAERILRAARDALAEIIGPAAEAPLARLQEDIPLPGPDPGVLDAWLEGAREGNLDLHATQINTEIARNEVKAMGAGHWPSLSLQGTYGVGESSGFNTGEFEQSRVSLNLTVPLFSGLATEARVRQSQSTYNQRLAELDGRRRNVERITRDAFQGVLSGAARVRALKQAVVSNTTAMEASEVGLQVGTRTAVDVLDAQRLLYAAQRDYARARYDYLLFVLRLKAAAGRLGEEDLAEINRLLVAG